MGEENGNPLHYSCLENPVIRAAFRATLHRIVQNQTRVKSLSMYACMHWRRKWQHTPLFLPGVSQAQRSLVGCHLWGHRDSDRTEAT